MSKQFFLRKDMLTEICTILLWLNLFRIGHIVPSIWLYLWIFLKDWQWKLILHTILFVSCPLYLFLGYYFLWICCVIYAAELFAQYTFFLDVSMVVFRILRLISVLKTFILFLGVISEFLRFLVRSTSTGTSFFSFETWLTFNNIYYIF